MYFKIKIFTKQIKIEMYKSYTEQKGLDYFMCFHIIQK